MPSPHRIEITNQQELLAVDLDQLTVQLEQAVVHAGLAGTGFISVALVDDVTICKLHGEFFGDDTPTDVITFPLEDPLASGPEQPPTGEVVISVETALRVADERQVDPHLELLLYAVHGLLHLAGENDQDPTSRARMQQREQEVLEHLGLHRP